MNLDIKQQLKFYILSIQDLENKIVRETELHFKTIKNLKDEKELLKTKKEEIKKLVKQEKEKELKLKKDLKQKKDEEKKKKLSTSTTQK